MCFALVVVRVLGKDRKRLIAFARCGQREYVCVCVCLGRVVAPVEEARIMFRRRTPRVRVESSDLLLLVVIAVVELEAAAAT